jgi:hypothetical protein
MEKINAKKLGITLALIFVVFLSLGGRELYTVYGEDEQLVFKDDMDVEEISEIYHEHMNNLFNKKAKLLVTGKEEEIDATVPDDGEKAGKIKYCKSRPSHEDCSNISSDINHCESNPNDKECLQTHEQCALLDKNVTTFCLAMESSTLYIKFKDALLAKWDDIPIEEDADMDLTDAFKAMQMQRTFINSEIDVSKKTLDSALAAYNELRWSFALHKEYKKIIKDLLKYRDKLADVRKYVEQYPDKFHDASTPYCK